jgi:hypothetical protein
MKEIFSFCMSLLANSRTKPLNQYQTMNAPISHLSGVSYISISLLFTELAVFVGIVRRQ